MDSRITQRRSDTLAKYDPEKGLKAIAVAEAAEKHFARAKDATQLQKAIRAKLKAQAGFVDWWDHYIEKNKGGGDIRKPKSTRSRSATGALAGKNGIPDRYVIQRWRDRLADPETFEATYQHALARYVQILELEQSAHVSQNSGENEWYTPADYIEAARSVLGAIDLDPASCEQANTVVRAATFFSTNGQHQPWHGRVWLNPPYAQPLIAEFAQKVAESVRASDVSAVIALVNNATETDWFQTISSVSRVACFPRGRVRFWNQKQESAAPLQGQVVLYAGPNTGLFCDAFGRFGFILHRVPLP